MAASTKSDRDDSELRLSATEARQIARLLSLLLRGAASDLPELLDQMAPEDISRTEERAILVGRAKAVLLERKRRSRFFAPVLFGEIGWDMLLSLYVSDFSGERQAINRLINWVGAPHTTALRWIAYLEKEGLVERVPHPNDRRTIFVNLRADGRELLDRYFGTLADPQNSL